MSSVLPTYVADIIHDVFLCRRDILVFYVDISYPKLRHFPSILDKCRHVGHVTTCLKTYATKATRDSQDTATKKQCGQFCAACLIYLIKQTDLVDLPDMVTAFKMICPCIIFIRCDGPGCRRGAGTHGIFKQPNLILRSTRNRQLNNRFGDRYFTQPCSTFSKRFFCIPNRTHLAQLTQNLYLHTPKLASLKV